MLATLEEGRGQLLVALEILETSFWDTSRSLIHPLDIELHKNSIQSLKRHGQHLADLYERMDRIDNATKLRSSLAELAEGRILKEDSKPTGRKRGTVERFRKRLIEIFQRLFGIEGKH